MYQYSKHGGAAQTVEPTMAGRGIYIFLGTPKNWPRDTPKNAISNRQSKRLKIAVSRTKQTTEAVSNRMKLRGFMDSIRGAKRAAVELAEAGPIGL
jgi:hypothetical protein